MADKLWNGDELDYTEAYCRAVTRFVLGAGAGEELNLAAAMGGLIPPRTQEKARVDQVTLSRQELLQAKAMLEDASKYLFGDCRRAGVYAGCIDYVLTKHE